MSEKTAADLVLELTEQVRFLSKLVQNQDGNIKLILKKLNSLEKSPGVVAQAPPPSPSAIPKVEPNYEDRIHKDSGVARAAVSVKAPQQPQTVFVKGDEGLSLKAEHAKTQESQFDKMKAQYGITDDPADDLLAGVARKQQKPSSSEAQPVNRRGQRVKYEANTDASKITVTQQLLADGKPLPLANVKIFDQFGQLVKNARTNTKGNWSAPLAPGEYKIEAVKNFVAEQNSNKPPVELSYMVEISFTHEGSIVLPPYSKD